MRSSAAKALSFVALATLATASTSSGEDEFPIVGTYTETALQGRRFGRQHCRVKITLSEIDSAFGLCTILQNKREGSTFAVHVDCKGPGGSQMLADIKFTLREDKTVDFSDQDQTYKAVLHKCR